MAHTWIATCSQFQSKPQIGEDATTLIRGETLEMVLQKLGLPLRREMRHKQNLIHCGEHLVWDNINHVLKKHFLGWARSIG
jgi:hypothetical protein